MPRGRRAAVGGDEGLVEVRQRKSIVPNREELTTIPSRVSKCSPITGADMTGVPFGGGGLSLRSFSLKRPGGLF